MAEHPEWFEEAMREHEATLAQTVPQASPEEYRTFLAEGVRIGTEQIAAGLGVTHEQVVAQSATRRAELVKRIEQMSPKRVQK